ncbi:hypothetical protein ARMGADRAFT_1036744 [Armillaria gallica]|uniref:Uncharacterized protein n=1 Tax=Armillaria gallica TaxID=47427 RepID=A0A2H3CTM7_ARMGA|nr:hypothetical protein ARMGADRAFT_1036744 [Armillaria gallica]
MAEFLAGIMGEGWDAEMVLDVAREDAKRLLQIEGVCGGKGKSGSSADGDDRLQKLRVKRRYRVQTELVVLLVDLLRDSQVVDDGILPLDHKDTLIDVKLIDAQVSFGNAIGVLLS